MSEKELLEIIEECMDLEEGTLSMDDELASYDEWDSLSVLALLAAIDAKCKKKVSAAEIKAVVTVADVVELMK